MTKHRFERLCWLGLVATCSVQAAPTLTVAGFGGDQQKDFAQALWKPAAASSGVDLRMESHGGIPTVKLQVQSGSPGWDVVHIGGNDCASLSEQGMFEPLDWSLIDTAGIAENARGKHWVAINTYSVVMAWRTDKFTQGPQSWAQFWDTEKFPGRRALSVAPDEMMEVALLADGVPKDKLYPLDVERG